MTAPGSLRQTFAAPYVGAYLAARTVSATGVWMERVVIGWLMWQATESPAWLGLLAFVRLAPALALTAWGGVLADRHGGLRVLAVAYAGQTLSIAMIAALVALLVTPGAGPLLAGATLLGVLQAIANAPGKSAIAEVAPRALLPRAIPLNAAAFNMAMTLGPALGAGLLVATSPAVVLAAAAAATAVFAVLLWVVPHPRPASPDPRSAYRAMRAAWTHARGHPVIAPALVLHTAFALLLRPVVDFLPALAGQLPGGGPAHLAMLSAALGAGAVAGGFALAFAGGGRGLGRRVALGGTVAAFALAAIGWLTAPLAMAICLTVMGFSMVLRGSGMQSLVQLTAAEAMRGRVMGLWGTILRGGGALGGLTLGLVAELVGLATALTCAATVLVLVLLLTWRSIVHPVTDPEAGDPA